MLKSRLRWHASRSLVLTVLCVLAGSGVAWAASATSTTMTVTSAGIAVASVAQGATVTLTATVLAGSTPVTAGQVHFCDATATHCTDIHLLATVELTSAGTAAFKFRPGPGSHSYKAVFVATTANAGSSSVASPLSVNPPAKLPTTTTITQSGNNSGYSLTATVYGNGSTAPTGTVSFLDTSNANTVIATALSDAGNGFGFVNSSNPTVGTQAIATGDFNSDGVPDLVVATPAVNGQAPGYLTVLLGNEDGTFTATAANPATGINPLFIATGDFNGDGNLDLAVANAASNTVTILLGNGDGAFTPTSATVPTGSDPVSIAVGDFNADGILDLAVANATGDNVTVLLGKGDGTFAPTSTSPVTGINPDSIAVGDFNGDGIPDLATANANSNSVTILLGNGDGSFTPAAENPATGSGPNAITVADFNGDGIADIATTNLGPTDTDGSITVLLGKGDGTFAPTSTSPVTGITPDAIAVGDFNADGVPDLVAANGFSNTMTVLLGAGDGTFTPIAASPITNSDPAGFAVADFNGDGHSDLAVGNDGSYNSNNVFGGNGVTLLLAASQVTTATATGVTISTLGPHLVEASYPGDSNYATSVSATTALTGPTESTTLTLSANPSSSVVAGGTVTLTATLSPSTYQGQTSNSETVTFLLDGNVMGTSTLTGGVATYVMTGTAGLQSAGQLTLSAKYAGDNYLSGSQSNGVPFTVTSGVSTNLALSVTPTTLTYTVGDSIGMTATLSPATYEGVSSDGSTVLFSYSNGVGGEQGGSGQVAGTLSGGVAATSANSLPAGVYSVQATFAATTSFASATSPTVTVTVNKATPTISLTSSANPAAAGASVTITATVAYQFPAQALQQTETVTFYDGATPLGTEPVVLGQSTATLVTSTLSAGSHSITAQYSGDIDNLSATSAPLNQVITSALATPTITLTSSANPASVSAQVTFTASLTSAAGTPTGSITFYDGTTQLGSGSVTSGMASCSTSTLAAGAHTITATYGGDSNFSSVTGSALTQTIEAFTLSAPGGGNIASQTASPGGQATYMLAVGPPSGASFPATVNFSVTGLPTGATASFTPPSLPQNSSVTNVTMTVTLPSDAALTHPLTGLSRGGLAPMALALLLLPFAGRMRRVSRSWKGRAWVVVLALAGMVFAGSLTACGGGSGGSSGSGGATPQTYSLTITATSGSLSQTTTTNLTVQ